MVRFRMFKINVDQFAILADNPVPNVKIDNKMSLDISQENRNIRINMTFNFSDGTNSLMLLKMNCEFNVHQEDWSRFQTEDKIVIPKSIIDYFVVQTVGTARGILHCKTEGSPFNYIVLPPMDVSQMVKEDIVFHIK